MTFKLLVAAVVASVSVIAISAGGAALA